LPESRESQFLPTAGTTDAGKTTGGSEVRDVVRWAVDDFEFSRDIRRHREDDWEEYWKIFMSEKRRPDVKGRSNPVSPHGGLTIRGLVPLIKRAILATRPFVRVDAHKKEVQDFVPLLEKQMDQWVDQARIRTIVLTHMLKEALALGTCWGKCDHVVRDRPIPSDRVDTGTVTDIFQPRARANDEIRELLYEGPWAWHIPSEGAYPYPLARDFTELEQHGYFIHQFFRSKSELLDDPRYDPDAVGKIGSLTPRHTPSHSMPLDQIFEEQRRRVLGLNVSQMRDQLAAMRERGDEPVEILEYVSRGSLYAIANRAIVVREESLDHHFPIFSLCPDPIPGEIFGKSVYHDARSAIDQRDFLTGNIYDNIARLVHGLLKGVPGMYDKTTLMPRPGGVVHVRNQDALMSLDQKDIVSSAQWLMSLVDRDVERGTGYSEILSNIGSGAGTVYPETARLGTRRLDNAMLFIGEMVSNIEEDGLKRMFEIFFDLERETMSAERWVMLAGEEGARWRDIDPDTLARSVDFRIIGAAYAAQQEEQQVAVQQTIGPILQIKTLEPETVDLRELARTLLQVYGVPNRDRIVKGEPTDVGPDAEHETMRQGLPVKPEAGEALQVHMQSHLAELERATTEEGEDPGYIERLVEHIQLTTDMIDRVSAGQEALRMQLAAELNSGNAQAVQPGAGEQVGALPQGAGAGAQGSPGESGASTLPPIQ
jgi:hypothetical protein